MSRTRWLAFGLAVSLAAWCSPAAAHGRVGLSIGVGLGIPVYPRPWCGWGYYGCYYRPYPVYVAPPPLYVAPAPIYVAPAAAVVQAVPAVQPTYALPAAPRRVQPVAASTAAYSEQGEVSRHLQQLAHPDDRVRLDSVTQLSRLKADRAIDPIAATLAGDRSPAVRDAAARALGIIGSPRGLPALERAAQVDPDRDVRRSAQFAVDVIQSRQ